MKITKRQLRRIIKEEKRKALREVTPGEREEALRLSAIDAGEGNPRHGGEHGVFSETYWENLVYDELKDYLQENDAQFLTPQEAKMIERSLINAANAAIMDLVG